MFTLLAQHPSVAAAFTKEVAFFNVNYHRGPRWYHRHFPSVAARRRYRRNTGTFKTFEATPTYLNHPHGAQQIKSLVPDARLVVLLRNPVDRAYSHYHLSRRIGYEKLSFEEAIDAEPARIAGEREKMAADERYHSFPLGYLAYVTMGQYAEQLQRWMEVFPREQFHDPHGPGSSARTRTRPTSRRSASWVCLSSNRPRPIGSLRSRQPPMCPATRRRLQEHFRPHNEQLKELLGARSGLGRTARWPSGLTGKGEALRSPMRHATAIRVRSARWHAPDEGPSGRSKRLRGLRFMPRPQRPRLP